MEVRDERIAEAYSGASEETIRVLNKLLGRPTDHTEGLVTNFDEAVKSIGRGHWLVSSYETHSSRGDNESEAFEMLRIVTAAINGNWSPCAEPDIEEQRWYPTFWFYTSKDDAERECTDGECVVEIDSPKVSMKAGVKVSKYRYCVVGASARHWPEFADGTSVRSLAFRSRERAIHAGRYFHNLYFRIIGKETSL